MFDMFGKKLSKSELLERVSSMSQVCGARVFTYQNGKASGLKAIDINAGCGLNFTILLDRGMDVGDAFYKGVPFGWKDKTGVVAPTYFENQGQQWLRSFFGGLFTTCGLTNVGSPCEYANYHHGLHGRISNTPAENYSVDEYWDGDDYTIKVTGKMREAVLYGENLTLTREIKTILGEKKIYIKDKVENEGYKPSPFMILYHINQPYPIVSEDSRLYTSAATMETIVEQNQKGGGDPYGMTEPIADCQYELYKQIMPEGKQWCYNAIINEKMNLGVYIKYDANELPFNAEWKMLGQQEYVVGLEPANTWPVGIAQAEKDGTLQYIQPNEMKEINFQIGIVDGEKEIRSLKDMI